MPYQTDERLKGFLDTHQLHREQMCRAVLAIDKRFKNVAPRHPRGGPDGGRDIEAVFADTQLAFGAVGFVNQATDSNEQKRAIKKKFGEDLDSAFSADRKPSVFVFFTNVNLTIGEKDALVAQAKKASLVHCEIFDRERIRIALDSPDGFAIRFQFLAIALSESEQASFFAKWGDDIQSVISTGFQQIEKMLERILFLQEATETLSGVYLRFELDRIYLADEIGHFRAFCYMHLKEPKLKIFGIVFGSSDKSNRMRSDLKSADEPAGIKHGISGGQWEEHVDLNEESSLSPVEEEEKPAEYIVVGSSSSVGVDPVEFIFASYDHDQHFIRFLPRLCMRDIDQASLMPMLNKSLAEKIKAIHLYANGYKLREITMSDFMIDPTPFEPDIPVEFTKDELSDPWIRIRPKTESVFSISFSSYTPRRLFTSRQIPDSLATRR